jgi:low affinity Fe/Cu permease
MPPVPSTEAHNNHLTSAQRPEEGSKANPDIFRRFAVWTANAVGHKWAFLAAIALIIGWAVTGPIFHFSDTWQLVINTGTTIITFLMVFLIQNTQNRDAKAIHLKLDELIRSIKGARNRLVNLEEWSDGELKSLHAQFEHVREKAMRRAQGGAESLHDAAGQVHATADKVGDVAERAGQTMERAHDGNGHR